jgi:hypothetical protein
MVQALPLRVLSLPVPGWALVAALAVSGLGNGLVNPTIHAMITLRPPPAVRAKVLAATFTASVLGARRRWFWRAGLLGLGQPRRDGGGCGGAAAGDAAPGRLEPHPLGRQRARPRCGKVRSENRRQTFAVPG